MIDLLKEARDLLVMCSLLDKSGQCMEMVEKIDAELDQSKCTTFFNDGSTTSATKCSFCSREKFEH